jgi:LPS-assembly protein
MKNKLNSKLLYIFILLFFLNSNAYSDQKFSYEAKNITIENNGKIIKGNDEVKVLINDNIVILADKLEYNTVTELLQLNGKTILEDRKNNIKIETTNLFFSKKENNIFSKTLANFAINKSYTITTNDFSYLLNKKEIISEKQVFIRDNIGNFFYVDNFIYKIKEKIFKGKNTKFIDLEKNEYLIQNMMIDLNDNLILGKDLNINFNKSIFGNQKNDPRLKAKTITKTNEISNFTKGVFTTCEKNDGCPPWSVYADKITHNDQKKTIFYKNAWLKIYDKPVFYFPRFSHPDPTVKRQSGFLTPTIRDSKNLGSSLELPYYYVISPNKDLTFKPRFYLNDQTIIQNEYRQINKNNNHIVDFSLNSMNYLESKKNNKTHFFSNSIFNLDSNYFDNSDIAINIEHVSNDTYLKKYKIDSPIIENNSILNSHFTFNAEKEDLYFTSSVGVYEDLSKSKSDRHEFVYPSYEVIKNFNQENSSYGETTFSSYGYQKKYETNIYEGLIANDLLFEGNKKNFDWGLTNSFSTLFKNVNNKGKNSPIYKNSLNQSLLSIIKFDNQLPLQKISEKFEKNLIPKLSIMYSPNKTKNMTQNENRIVNINNIYSLNRIGARDTVEGGVSLTFGTEYNKFDKKNRSEIINFNLATILRKNKNDDLPMVSSIGEKKSNIFGNFNFSPYKNFDLSYNFEINNDLDKSEYDLLKTNYKINNFVTSFEYLDDKNIKNGSSYISNNSSLIINNNNSIGFNIRKNRRTHATEFYDIYFTYFNDCLEASVKFNKEYYRDSDLEPEKQLLFSLTIVPFGKIDSIGINN